MGFQLCPRTQDLYPHPHPQVYMKELDIGRFNKNSPSSRVVYAHTPEQGFICTEESLAKKLWNKIPRKVNEFLQPPQKLSKIEKSFEITEAECKQKTFP